MINETEKIEEFEKYSKRVAELIMYFSAKYMINDISEEDWDRVIRSQIEMIIPIKEFLKKLNVSNTDYSIAVKNTMDKIDNQIKNS